MAESHYNETEANAAAAAAAVLCTEDQILQSILLSTNKTRQLIECENDACN
jgi:hypothetical protein